MGRHQKTLRAIAARPTPSNLPWRDIESLFRHLGADIEEREGSRVAVSLNGIIGHFHRPHPRKEADKGCVVSVREFLENAGALP